MSSDLVQTQIYFPEKSQTINSKSRFADAILDLMRKDDSISYAGYAEEHSLREGIIRHLGDGDPDSYSQISKIQEEDICLVINNTFTKCNERLKVPTKNYVFVFPYLPSFEEEVFEGVMGVAPYSCVLHIFLSPEKWSSISLANTIAHELNHTVYYYNHFSEFDNYPLFDQMIIEGLAETFREEVFDSTPARWAIALTEQEALNIFGLMSKEELLSRDDSFINDVLFGGGKYKRWSGYSIGYWLVKRWRKINMHLTWDQVMKLAPEDICKDIKEKRA